jgi:hypothetical protein
MSLVGPDARWAGERSESNGGGAEGLARLVSGDLVYRMPTVAVNR